MSDGIKRKVRISANLYETTNSNRLKTGGTLTASIYAGGVQIESAQTIPASPSTIALACSGRGALPSSGTLAVVRQNGTVWERVDTGGQVIVVSNIEENVASVGEFFFTLTDTSGTTLNVLVGDRLVMLPASYATLYEDEGENSDTVTNPIDVPDSGAIEFYVEHNSVDVYLSGSTITDGWYAFNIPAQGVGIGPLRLVAETAAANGSNILNIDATTGVVNISSATNAIATIEHATRERIIVLYPTVASVQLTTVNTKADNTIYEATGRTITLSAEVPVILQAHEGASPSVSYWTLLGNVAATTIALDDITDVDATSAVANRPLVYDGANWIDGTQLGSAGTPFGTIYVDETGFFLVESGGFTAQLSVSSITANRSYTLPDSNGEVVVNSGTQNVTGRKSFDDSASGFRIVSTTGTNRIVVFDASGITDSTTRTVTLPDKSVTMAMTSDVRQSLDSLEDTDLTSPGAGNPLVFDGTNWVEADQTVLLGSSTDPVGGIWVRNSTSGGVRYNSFTNTGYLLSDVLSADRQWLLPDAGGEVLVNAGAPFSVTRSFWFDDSASEGLFDQLLNHKNASLVMVVPSVLNDIVITEVYWEWNLSANSTAATPTTVNLYEFSTYTPGTTVPPTGGTAVLTSAVGVPSSGTSGSTGNTTSFSNATITGGNYLALGIAANNDEPGVAGELVITVNYTVDQA